MIENISPLGFFHTFIGILALVSGFTLLWKNKSMSYKPTLGKVYFFSTVITAVTSLMIFKHGSFNIAHALGVLTIAAVFVGIFIEKTVLFKSLNKYCVNLCYSSTILFHLLPTATEILTRFPKQAPLVTSLEAPLLQKTFLVILIVFLIGLTIQMLWLKKSQPK